MLTLAAAGLLASLLLGGCGKPTAQAVATQYVALMASGKFADAAALWDLQAEGRAQASDWDTFGQSQRKLIIMKDLAPKKAEVLQQLASYFPAETKVTQVTESGGTAQAALEGGRVSRLQLVKVGDDWKISGMN
jgi:hypothetical protein